MKPRMGSSASSWGRIPVWAGILAITALIPSAARAYETYTNCASCHGDFRATSYTSQGDGQSWGSSLHDVHRNTMLGGDCNTCHSGASRTPVYIASSAGGSGLAAISCVGCHGRSQDGTGSGTLGYGAGLRQHHYRAGETVCASCHSDSNPANKQLAGENVLPPYYANTGTNHPNIPTNACNPAPGYPENFAATTRGLDNDGDLAYDGADSDCAAASVCGNGVREGSEQCDDNNTANGDCCSSTCRYEAPGTACNDGRYCTTEETCNSTGVCGGGAARSCNDNNICTDDTCNETAGRCDNILDPTNDPSCAPAVCGNGVREGSEQCDDNNTANGDCCSSTCRYEAPGTACNDGRYCTTGETCNSTGVCGGGAARNCSDNVSCTTDACDDARATCVHTANSALCDDGVYCNGEETCDAAAGCAAGTPVDCDDANTCTDDSCNETARRCDNVFDPTNDPSCAAPCPDADRDGFADCTVPSCDATGLTCGDCNDADPLVNPAATENCANGKDDDCDGAIDAQDTDCAGCLDADGDGYSPLGGDCGPVDCRDDDPAANPAAREICSDGIDNDCDGFIDGADSDCSVSDVLGVNQVQTPRSVVLRGSEPEVRRVKVVVQNLGDAARRVHVLLTSDAATGITIAPFGPDTVTIQAGQRGVLSFAVAFDPSVLAGRSQVSVHFTAVAVDENGHRSSPASPKWETVVQSWSGQREESDLRLQTARRTSSRGQ